MKQYIKPATYCMSIAFELLQSTSPDAVEKIIDEVSNHPSEVRRTLPMYEDGSILPWE